MENPGDYGEIAESRRALDMADWVTERLSTRPYQLELELDLPERPQLRRCRPYIWRPPRVAILAAALLIIGALVGVGSTWAYQRLAAQSPLTSAAGAPKAAAPSQAATPTSRTPKVVPAATASPAAPTAPSHAAVAIPLATPKTSAAATVPRTRVGRPVSFRTTPPNLQSPRATPSNPSPQGRSPLGYQNLQSLNAVSRTGRWSAAPLR